MSKHNKADEARRGLIDSVKGKAKGVKEAVAEAQAAGKRAEADRVAELAAAEKEQRAND